MMYKKIGIDIDDTLLDFIGAYVLFYNTRYKTNFKREDFKSYMFNETLGGTLEESVNSVKKFCNSSFVDEMKPLPDSQKVIQMLNKQSELFLVTSRTLDLKEITLNQISKYFPNLFSDILFSSNHYTKSKNTGKPKSEICLEKGISLLIDDSLIYTNECLEKNIGAILFDSPWNQNGHLKGIIRVKSWEEIGKLLLK